MKLRTLRIQNLLAIRDASIMFDETGVHHIIGRNNVGKSALVKSINILLNNIPQTDVKEYLRDGAATFKLTGEFYDGSTVVLSRGATDYYEWNVLGEAGRLDKTKGKVPDALTRYFRLYTDAEKTKECLNIRLPRDVLTFVDTTKSENDYLLQKAMGTEEFLLASQKAEAKKREITAEQKRLREYIGKDAENIAAVETELLTMKDLASEQAALVARIEAEYAIYEEIQQLVQYAEQLGELDQQIRDITNGIDIERGEQLKQEILELEMTMRALETVKLMDAQEIAIQRHQREVAVLEEVHQAVQAYNQVAAMQKQAVALLEINHTVSVQQQAVADADNAYMDFMVSNKFCPLVMNTLDQRCPFGATL